MFNFNISGSSKIVNLLLKPDDLFPCLNCLQEYKKLDFVLHMIKQLVPLCISSDEYSRQSDEEAESVGGFDLNDL